jgi:hypothetical protein
MIPQGQEWFDEERIGRECKKAACIARCIKDVGIATLAVRRVREPALEERSAGRKDEERGTQTQDQKGKEPEDRSVPRWTIPKEETPGEESDSDMDEHGMKCDLAARRNAVDKEDIPVSGHYDDLIEHQARVPNRRRASQRWEEPFREKELNPEDQQGVEQNRE